ncbi:MAG: hypothetical protein OXC46_04895 [Thaumarchaeota archaeon]|nr:hypothetical protein [Nitrososphaerota archaeon]
MTDIYESTAKGVVKRKLEQGDDPKKVGEHAISKMMRWMWKPDRKKVEAAVDKAVSELQIDESKTARKLDVLVSHK